MQPRKIREGVRWMGAIDWDRRLFDSLIPLPDGTSYNAYLIEGSEKTVLVDSVDPPMTNERSRASNENALLLTYVKDKPDCSNDNWFASSRTRSKRIAAKKMMFLDLGQRQL